MRTIWLTDKEIWSHLCEFLATIRPVVIHLLVLIHIRIYLAKSKNLQGKGGALRIIVRYRSGLTPIKSTLQRKFHLCIPREGIARPQFQFPHSCVCSMIGRPIAWIYSINRSQTHECRNWDWDRAIPIPAAWTLYSRSCTKSNPAGSLSSS